MKEDCQRGRFIIQLVRLSLVHILINARVSEFVECSKKAGQSRCQQKVKAGSIYVKMSKDVSEENSVNIYNTCGGITFMPNNLFIIYTIILEVPPTYKFRSYEICFGSCLVRFQQGC